VGIAFVRARDAAMLRIFEDLILKSGFMIFAV
jgi:hypothetical protein